MAAWERITAWLLFSLLMGASARFFIFDVSLSATMHEYLFKFLTELIDKGLTAIFDFNGLGDPRPRLVTTFLTWVNINIRQFLLTHCVMHPSFGINWVLYPLCLVVIFRLVGRLTHSRRCAFMAMLLYAASPALLDGLVNYYVPAKPLINFLMLAALYGGSLLVPNRDEEARPLLGSVVLFLSGLVGLLTDETAGFIYLCVPVVFCQVLFSSRFSWSRRALCGGSLVLSFLSFAALSFYLLPLINQKLEQMPVDLEGTIRYGANQTMFFDDPAPLEDLAAQYSPGSLLETILSVHGVPDRRPAARYLANPPIPHFRTWRRREQLALYFLVGALIFLAVNLRRQRERFNLGMRLLAAFAVFVLGEAFLLLPLAPCILETNYYAALASLFFALFVGLCLGSFHRGRWSRRLAWTFLSYLLVVQFTNFQATATRHSSIFWDEAPPAAFSWSAIREVHGQVSAGRFDLVARQHPFPSRLFYYAFELEAAREKQRGRTVDIQPMKDASPNLFGCIDIDAIPNMAGPYVAIRPAAPLVSEKDLLAAGARRIQGPALAALFTHQVFVGRAGRWGYVRKLNGSGGIQQRFWRENLARVWADQGKIDFANNQLNLSLLVTGQQCLARVYEWQGIFYAYGPNEELVTLFAKFK